MVQKIKILRLVEFITTIVFEPFRLNQVLSDINSQINTLRQMKLYLKKCMPLFVMLFYTAIGYTQNNVRIIEGLTMNSKLLNVDVKYSIILPEDYDSSNKSYPVVYLLHGLGDNESSWLEYGRVNHYADNAVKCGEIVPMIFIMPQGFRSYYVNDYAGKFLYEDMFTKELVPFIDASYRTIPNKEHRATMGYSMGGFGALILPLKNPDLFTISVPLSISVRTDEQYKIEDTSEWNEQWGRLFGGEGTIGQERITDYYKQHSPFHIFAQSDLTKFKNLKLYIDNGDDEQTLSRSNEELHILLRNRNYPHEFRVRNGGHEFSYWREALPNGLRFISDAFEDKAYRGDKINLASQDYVPYSFKNRIINNNQYEVLLPEEYDNTLRLYPVIYFIGDFNQQMKESIAIKIQKGIYDDSLAPLIAIFVNEKTNIIKDSIIPFIEKKYRARIGYRFRALIGFEKGGELALNYALTHEMFTSCAVFDAPINYEFLEKAISERKKNLKRTWLFIASTDKSMNYMSNGRVHTFLRDQDFYHEYRIQEGSGGNAWFLNSLTEALNFTQRKIHR
ncbi:MAG: alpha/beta hydrolase-fold protein [Lutibacter sp.]